MLAPAKSVKITEQYQPGPNTDRACIHCNKIILLRMSCLM